MMVNKSIIFKNIYGIGRFYGIEIRELITHPLRYV
jgi:hypothetical protein